MHNQTQAVVETRSASHQVLLIVRHKHPNNVRQSMGGALGTVQIFHVIGYNAIRPR